MQNTSLTKTETHDIINPIPRVNIKKQTNIYGINIYQTLIEQAKLPKPTFDNNINPNHGIKVSTKLIPTNKHLDIGKNEKIWQILSNHFNVNKT